MQQGSDWKGADFGACTINDNEQSPINLVKMQQTHDDVKVHNGMTGKVFIDNARIPVVEVNTGKTILVTADEGKSYITANLEDSNGEFKSYSASQFHFHSPSEHHDYGEELDL